MPYIEQYERNVFTDGIEELARHRPSTGELNYIITKLLLDFVKRNGRRYEIFDRVLGILSAVDKEFYRKVVAVYEDEKCKTNGEVF